MLSFVEMDLQTQLGQNWHCSLALRKMPAIRHVSDQRVALLSRMQPTPLVLIAPAWLETIVLPTMLLGQVAQMPKAPPSSRNLPDSIRGDRRDQHD